MPNLEMDVDEMPCSGLGSETKTCIKMSHARRPKAYGCNQKKFTVKLLVDEEGNRLRLNR